MTRITHFFRLKIFTLTFAVGLLTILPNGCCFGKLFELFSIFESFSIFSFQFFLLSFKIISFFVIFFFFSSKSLFSTTFFYIFSKICGFFSKSGRVFFCEKRKRARRRPREAEQPSALLAQERTYATPPPSTSPRTWIAPSKATKNANFKKKWNARNFWNHGGLSCWKFKKSAWKQGSFFCHY